MSQSSVGNRGSAMGEEAGPLRGRLGSAGDASLARGGLEDVGGLAAGEGARPRRRGCIWLALGRLSCLNLCRNKCSFRKSLH